MTTYPQGQHRPNLHKLPAGLLAGCLPGYLYRTLSAKKGLACGVLTAGVLFVAQASALAQGPAASQPQPRLPMVELRAGMHLIRAEVANTPAARSTGLMWRQTMGQNDGMLFVFEVASPQCFWMKNTLLPLSIAFIDDKGVVVNIADMKPMDETSHCSAKPVRFALEMHQGWFAKRGIKAGTTLNSKEVWGN
jgi:uncharacterized protein